MDEYFGDGFFYKQISLIWIIISIEAPGWIGKVINIQSKLYWFSLKRHPIIKANHKIIELNLAIRYFIYKMFNIFPRISIKSHIR